MNHKVSLSTRNLTNNYSKLNIYKSIPQNRPVHQNKIRILLRIENKKGYITTNDLMGVFQYTKFEYAKDEIQSLLNLNVLKKVPGDFAHGFRFVVNREVMFYD